MKNAALIYLHFIYLLKWTICISFYSYQKSNGAPPQRIVFYRDGVGAGQEDNVRAQEVEQIKAFFERQGMNVKFTFIIVAKRINTRFYKKQGNQVLFKIITLKREVNLFTQLLNFNF